MQYENPTQDQSDTNKVPKFKEYSDEMETVYLLDRILSRHFDGYDWCEKSVDLESIIQENDLLAKYVSHCNSLPLSDARALTKMKEETMQQIHRIDTDFVDSYINGILVPKIQHPNRMPDASAVLYLEHRRTVIHSKSWSSVYGDNKQWHDI